MALLEVFFTLLWLSALSEAHNFTADFLKTVNQYRKNHKAGSLILDSKLSEKAQQLANAIAKDGNFSKPTEPGENTFMLCTNYNRALRAKEAVKAWYNFASTINIPFFIFPYLFLLTFFINTKLKRGQKLKIYYPSFIGRWNYKSQF